MKFQVNKELYFAIPTVDERLQVNLQAVSYVSTGHPLLVQLWQTARPDQPEVAYYRRSEDNGLTWSVSEELFEASSSSGDRDLGLDEGFLRQGNYLFFLDREKDALLLAYWRAIYEKGDTGWDAQANKSMSLQLSRDGGRTWSEPEQIIAQGGPYDAAHWAPEVDLGRVGGMMAGIPAIIKSRSGDLLLPFQLGATGRVLKQGVMIGRWRNDGKGLDWEVGNYVEEPTERSRRGCFAGTLAELSDGRVLMIMRGDSRDTIYEGDVKRMTLSGDGGRSWRTPRPITYEDGSIVWSVSSNPRLMTCERTGRLFLITHIVDKPVLGQSRRPLCIAEVDREKAVVIKDSVTVVCDREPDEIESAYFEPRGIYQDRESGNLVLFVGSHNLPGTTRVFRCEVSV